MEEFGEVVEAEEVQYGVQLELLALIHHPVVQKELMEVPVAQV